MEERVVVELIKLVTQSPGKRVAKPEAEHRVPDRGANLAVCHIPVGETAPVVEEMHLTVSCTPCLMPHSQECPDGGLAPREGLAQRLRSRSCDGASFPVPGTGRVITNKLKTFKCWCYHFVSNCMEVKNVLCFYQNTVTTGIIGSISLFPFCFNSTILFRRKGNASSSVSHLWVGEEEREMPLRMRPDQLYGLGWLLRVLPWEEGLRKRDQDGQPRTRPRAGTTQASHAHLRPRPLSRAQQHTDSRAGC